MTNPSFAGVTDTDDLYGNVLTRNQATGVLMPRHDAAPDIILIVGQSNASGNGHPIRSRTAAEQPLLQWWHTGTDTAKGTTTLAVEPTAKPYDGSAGTSPGVEFARCWADWYRRPTIVVPAAWGGTGLISGGARWQETGDLYQAAVREAQDAIAATGGRLVAIIWCQGEQDSLSGVSDSPADGYSTVAARVLGAMRTALGAPDAVVAVGSMVPDWVALGKGTAVTIQAALAAIPSKLSRCVHAYGGFGTGGEGGTGDPGIHYNALGTQQLGRALWAAYRRLLDPTLPPGRPAAPGVTPTATGCAVRWSPAVAAEGYECRWRTGTGAWQALTPSGLTASLTAGTGVLVEVQVRSTASGKPASAWSQSTLAAPVLAAATLLMDVSGPGPAHLGRGDISIGGGRVASQTLDYLQPIVDRDDGVADAAAFRFGGSQYLGAPVLTLGNLASSAGQFTVIAVAQADVPHDGSFFGWRSEAVQIASMGVQSDGTAIAQAFDDSNAVVTATHATDVTRPHIYQMLRWDRGVSFAIDEGATRSISGPWARTGGSAQLVIGAAYRKDVSTAPVQMFKGRLAFLCVLPFSATDTQLVAIRRYLQARYNL